MTKIMHTIGRIIKASAKLMACAQGLCLKLTQGADRSTEGHEFSESDKAAGGSDPARR